MEDLTADEWDELMSVEENHGRSRVDGSWHGLDNLAALSLEENFEYIVHVPIHGLNSTYINAGCRCASCRRAHRDYERDRYNRK
jgi:hypothetical protein